MITYKWDVVNTDYKTSNKFITTVHYVVLAVDGEFTASTYGTVGYIESNEPMKPFADLTQAEVIGWVQGSLGKDIVEASLDTQIEALKNPVQATGLPWVTVAENIPV